MVDVKSTYRETRTISVRTANIFGLLIIFPILIAYFVPYYLLHFDENTIPSFKAFVKAIGLEYGSIGLSLIIFGISVLGIIAHELIHGICWSLFTKNGFNSIKFGVVWKMFTPYCHCKEPLKVSQYIFGAIMPGIVLGLLPAAYAILYDNFEILIFGIFFTIGAGGDILMIYLLRNEKMNSRVQDHPSKVGCYIFVK